MTAFKTITMNLSDEDQVYVVESQVTLADIASGNEAGIVCHMVDASKAELIVSMLNEHSCQHRRVGQ